MSVQAVADDRITLRFLAAPSDVAASGLTIAAGRVLEWIDKAGYACAVGWSGSYCVTAYVGDIRFNTPIRPGNLIEAHARIVHTGRTSMHVLVTVDATDVRERDFRASTQCLLVFVAIDDAGVPRGVPQWVPRTERDLLLSARAISRIEPRRIIRTAMNEQAYTDEGTTPRTVFRFLAAPGDANWGGNAHGGTVMRWIDEAAFACAASWSSDAAVAVYSGGIHFYHPIHIGHIVEVDARIIHTSSRSMHLSILVRSGAPGNAHNLQLTTRCLTVMVELNSGGQAGPIRAVALNSDEDRRLDEHARALIEVRASLAAIPVVASVHTQ